MKKNHLISGLLLISIACCKPLVDDCRSEGHKGYLTADINSESWEAYPFALETSVLGIVGDYYEKSSCRLQQTLTIIIPSKEGNFLFSNEVDSINGKATILFSYKDDDVPLGNYSIREGNDNGLIEITNYDATTKKIAGNFACTLHLKQNFELPPDHTDSLVIIDGQFETYFRE